MFVDHVCQPCLSTMFVNHVCQPCLSTMFVNHVCQPCLSTMFVNLVCQPCFSTMLVNHVCQPCLSIVFVNRVCKPCVNNGQINIFYLLCIIFFWSATLANPPLLYSLSTNWFIFFFEVRLSFKRLLVFIIHFLISLLLSQIALSIVFTLTIIMKAKGSCQNSSNIFFLLFFASFLYFFSSELLLFVIAIVAVIVLNFPQLFAILFNIKKVAISSHPAFSFFFSLLFSNSTLVSYHSL